MKYWFCILLYWICLSAASGQNCGLVSTTRNKQSGVETRGAVVSTKNFYSLLVQRKMVNAHPQDSLNYFLLLNAAAKTLLPEEMLQTRGDVLFELSDGSTVVIKNAQAKNDPLGISPSVGFLLRTNQATIDKLRTGLVVKLSTFFMLETELTSRQQKQLQQVLNCLLQ